MSPSSPQRSRAPRPPTVQTAPATENLAPHLAPAAAFGCTFDDALAPLDAARLLQAALAALPNQAYGRALVAPCGGGALAACLPAQRVVGLDEGRALLGKAQRRLTLRPDRARFSLLHGGLPELVPPAPGQGFDLVVLDGVREELASLPAAALRLALDAQLALEGVLLLFERAERPLGPLAYTPLQTTVLQLGDLTLRLRCYWR